MIELLKDDARTWQPCVSWCNGDSPGAQPTPDAERPWQPVVALVRVPEPLLYKELPVVLVNFHVEWMDRYAGDVETVPPDNQVLSELTAGAALGGHYW